MSLNQKTVAELHELLVKKEASSLETTEAVLKRIEAIDDKVKAFVTITKEEALAQAKAVDEKINRGEKIGPLEGIPMVLKDNVCTEGILTTCSSKMLHNFVPPYDATVVNKLKDAGAILIGKANMDEFAIGSSTESAQFSPTKNPWNLDYVPGGSSGGSAASVAADEAIFSLGSDTSGSIRQPAAFCGVVGLKPTYSVVSRYGLIAMAPSMDQIGPLAKDVKDSALVMNVISGHDPLDSTSAEIEYPDYTSFLNQDIKGLKVGIPKEYFAEGMDSEVEKSVKDAIKQFEALGAICEEVSLPHTEYALPAYQIMASAEVSSSLASYDGVGYGYRHEEVEDLITMYRKTRSQGFGEGAKRRIILGTYVLSAGQYETYYLKALKVRTLIKQDFAKAFAKYDLLLAPTTPTLPFKAGTKTNDPMQMYLADRCTVSVNLAGIPAISIPCGFSNSLPVGLQLIGKAFDEGTLLKAAHAYEQSTDHHKHKPNL